MRKWRAGEVITDVHEAVAIILAGQPMFMRHKCQNAGWMQNTSIAGLRGLVGRCVLRRAVKIEQENDNE